MSSVSAGRTRPFWNCCMVFRSRWWKNWSGNRISRSRLRNKVSLQTLRAAISGRPHADCLRSGLDRLDVLCLPALGAFHNVKLYLLTFLKAAEAAGLNGGEMNENILAVLAA